MANAYYAVYEHIVFSTRRRTEWITDELAPKLFAYLAGAVKAQGCQVLLVGGHRNHVHLLVRKKGEVRTPDLVKEIKRTSSHWVKTESLASRNFYWQRGYGAFSVSYEALDRIRSYIQHQAEHHRKMTWEEEYRRILKKGGVVYDERYYLE